MVNINACFEKTISYILDKRVEFCLSILSENYKNPYIVELYRDDKVIEKHFFADNLITAINQASKYMLDNGVNKAVLYTCEGAIEIKRK